MVTGPNKQSPVHRPVSVWKPVPVDEFAALDRFENDVGAVERVWIRTCHVLACVDMSNTYLETGGTQPSTRLSQSTFLALPVFELLAFVSYEQSQRESIEKSASAIHVALLYA